MMTATTADILRNDCLGVRDGMAGGQRRVTGLVGFLLTCIEVARQRRELLALDDRALSDIGISRADAEREAMRSFWDLPERRNSGC